jgi:hypothetical protein
VSRNCRGSHRMKEYVMELDMQNTAEVYDALEAVDELSIVLSRLKRLGLLTPEENHEIVESVATITDTLRAKLPASDPYAEE